MVIFLQGWRSVILLLTFCCLYSCATENGNSSAPPEIREVPSTSEMVDSMVIDWAEVTRVVNLQQMLQQQAQEGRARKGGFSPGIIGEQDSLSYLLRNDSVQIVFNWIKTDEEAIYHAFLLDQGKLSWVRTRDWINRPDSSYANEFQYYLQQDTIVFATEKQLPLLYNEAPSKMGNLPIVTCVGSKEELRNKVMALWEPVKHSLEAHLEN